MQKSKNIFTWIILAASIIILFLSFYRMNKANISSYNLDLRNRVVGTRLIGNESDIYHLKCYGKISEKYLIPNSDTTAKYNYITSTPAYLLILKPLSKLSYDTLKKVWFYINYFLLIICAFVFLYFERKHEKKYWQHILVISLTLISGAWYLNILLGQNYIVFVLFLCILFALIQKESAIRFLLFGIVIGLSSWIRFPFILITIPFLIQFNKKILTGLLLGLTFGSLLFYFSGYQKDWKDYSKSAIEWAENQNIQTKNTFNNTSIRTENVLFNEIQNSETIHKYVQLENSSIRRILFTKFGIQTPAYLLIILLILLLLSILLFLKKEMSQFNSLQLLLIGSVFMLLFDFFSPVTRSAYHAILWLFPLLLFANLYDWSKLPKLTITLIAIGLFLNLGEIKIFPYSYILGEMLYIGVIIYTLKFAKSRNLH